MHRPRGSTLTCRTVRLLPLKSGYGPTKVGLFQGVAGVQGLLQGAQPCVITQPCVDVGTRLCSLTESLNSGDSLKESDFGRNVSGLLAQKSDSPRLVGPYPDSWAKSRKVGASKSAPTRHFQEVGSKAKRSDHLPFLGC